ncbi:carbohydrate-binding module family 20 domain-containing protein [Pseudomonas sp. H1h]|uniref:carbohydrate-binding module family 20 domain-containing protein n=1 Tax=Pseudomonas sp. H1h TaxID=1397280 RepID=UPI00046AD17A|nr:carbohydrate-binding module family 20 domain-containing protein [Pseudomonas sp. H1h]
MNRIRYLLPLSALLLALPPIYGYAGATWTYISLEANFRCDNGVTTQGYSVYAVGDRPELGNWDAAKAVRLTASSPSWSGLIKFSNAKPGDVVEWKCIVRNDSNPSDATWQTAPNNRVTLAFSPTPLTTGSF